MNIYDYLSVVNLEESAGLQIEVAIADYRDVQTFPALPDLDAALTNSDHVDLGAAVFVMKAGKKFHKFEGSLEKNSFASNLVGPRGAKSFENTLTVIRNAVNKDLTGWLRANRNRPLIVAFRPLGEDQYIFLGYNGLWAEVDEASMDIPGEIAGEKMSMFTVRSIYHPPLYIDSIPFTASTEGTAEVASLLMTSSATSAGDVTVTLNGIAQAIAVAINDTAAQVAAKIRATVFAGWTTGGTAETVTFTANTTGARVDATYSAGTTGAAGTMTTTVQGT